MTEIKLIGTKSNLQDRLQFETWLKQKHSKSSIKDIFRNIITKTKTQEISIFKWFRREHNNSSPH